MSKELDALKAQYRNVPENFLVLRQIYGVLIDTIELISQSPNTSPLTRSQIDVCLSRVQAIIKGEEEPDPNSYSSPQKPSASAQEPSASAQEPFRPEDNIIAFPIKPVVR